LPESSSPSRKSASLEKRSQEREISLENERSHRSEERERSQENERSKRSEERERSQENERSKRSEERERPHENKRSQRGHARSTARQKELPSARSLHNFEQAATIERELKRPDGFGAFAASELLLKRRDERLIDADEASRSGTATTGTRSINQAGVAQSKSMAAEFDALTGGQSSQVEEG
jgi:hypothetical protein